MTMSDPRLNTHGARLSALRATFLVAAHHGVSLRPEDLPKLTDGDLAPSVMQSLTHAGFRTRQIDHGTWATLSGLGTAYPALLPMRDGRWVILVLTVVKEAGRVRADSVAWSEAGASIRYVSRSR